MSEIKKSLSRTMGDVHAGVPVPVADESATGTLVQDAGCLMDVSASAAYLRRICCFHSDHFDAFLCSDLFQCGTEQLVWHPFHTAVRFPVQSAFVEAVQVFDGDVGIVFYRQVDDPVGCFVASGLDESFLVAEQSLELVSGFFAVCAVAVSLEFASADVDIPLFLPYVSSEVQLFFDGGVFVQYADCCKSPAPDVDTDNAVVGVFDVEVFLDTEQEAPSASVSFQSEAGGLPSLSEVVFESFPCTVPADWDSGPPVAVECCDGDDRVLSFGDVEVSASGYIVRWACGFEAVHPIVLPCTEYIPYQVFDELGLKFCIVFDVPVFAFMQIVACKGCLFGKSIPVAKCLEKMVSALKPFILKFREEFFLLCSHWEKVDVKGLGYFRHLKQVDIWRR